MRNTLRNLVLLASLTSAQVLCGSSKAQNNFPDVKYWIGSGSDSAVLVVDFHDQTWDTCYAWGYLFNGTTTGEDMLNAVAAEDVNFYINISSGFLNDVIYGNHAGIGGSPDWWSTWSGQDTSSLSSNGGVGTTVNPGDWFACSYTDFSPAVPPGPSIPAFDSAAYSFEDPTFWVGSGTDTSVLVIDFLDSTGNSSFAWGYLHDGTKTGEDMLAEIDAADPNLSVNLSGGFLLDVTYDTYVGNSGAPNFWGTWSGTNLGNWDTNGGPASVVLTNRSFFGCSYTDFNPARRPGYPTSALQDLAVDNIDKPTYSLYPNPAIDVIRIDGLEKPEGYSVYSMEGTYVQGGVALPGNQPIDIGSLAPGIYTLKTEGQVLRFVKK